MKIRYLCHRKAVTVSASAPVSDAARLMAEECIGALVVTATPDDEPVAVGMLTDRDIVLAQLDHTADLGALRVGEIMTGDPLVLNADAPAEEAIRSLRDRHVRRAPVISATGQLVGVISFDDLLAHVCGSLRALAHLADVRSKPTPAMDE